MKKVFNIGFSKTGTTSFEYAMEILGFKTYHGNYNLKHNDYLMSLWVNKDFLEIKKMSNYWDAFADVPWGGTNLYIKLLEWYPDAKFIYTIRNSDDWYNSLYKMLTRFDDNPLTALDTYHANERYGFTYFLKREYNIDNLVDVKDKIIKHFENHKKDVIEHFENKGKEILFFDPINNEGWKKLCPFLDKPIPNCEYPHRNKYIPIQFNNTQPKKIDKISEKLKRKIKSILKL